MVQMWHSVRSPRSPLLQQRRLRPKDASNASGVMWYSLEDRYCTHEAYVVKVLEAARRLVEQRFLLQDDADRIIREAVLRSRTEP